MPFKMSYCFTITLIFWLFMDPINSMLTLADTCPLMTDNIACSILSHVALVLLVPSTCENVEV